MIKRLGCSSVHIGGESFLDFTGLDQSCDIRRYLVVEKGVMSCDLEPRGFYQQAYNEVQEENS